MRRAKARDHTGSSMVLKKPSNKSRPGGHGSMPVLSEPISNEFARLDGTSSADSLAVWSSLAPSAIDRAGAAEEPLEWMGAGLSQIALLDLSVFAPRK